MKLQGAVGSSSQQRSLPWDMARSVNVFPLVDQQGKEPTALYGTPGLQMFGVAGTGPGRGGFAATNGRSFVVSGANLYEVDSAGVTTQRGTLITQSSIVTMDENGFQLAICDGTNLYIFTYATNAFVRVQNANLPSASSVTFIDGYFITNRNNSGVFQISALYDGTQWAALDFASAESSPDGLLRVLNVSGNLWLFGAKTTEIWSNTGSSPFPFQRIAGGKIETGILSPYTAIALDNTVYWVGRDTQGAGVLYRAEGFSTQRVSIDPMEIRMQAAPTPDTLRCWSYQEEGHTFVMVTGGGMETSLVYDLATQQWHERAFLNEFGQYELHLGAFGFYSFNKLLVLDRRNGSIYTQDLDFVSDAGEEIAHDRIFTHLFDENKRFVISDLTLEFEVGTAPSTGVYVNPQVTLWISRDGGKTWSNGIRRSLGRIGEYRQRITYRRLGQGRQITFRIRVSDAVRFAFVGASFNNGGA